MKTIVHISLIAVSLFVADATNAQVFKISSIGQNNLLLGDFNKNDINNPDAGYAQYAVSAGVEFNYYTKTNLGFGVRWMSQSYQIDRSTFESDFIGNLGLTDETVDISQPLSYWSMGTDFGVSYLIDIDESWQVEPYFYFGFRRLVRRNIDAIYSDNGSTFQYQSRMPVFYGSNFIPGAKLHWNFSNHFGAFISAEFQGLFFFENEETVVASSSNSLDIATVKRSFDASSFNLGLGLAFRFGKGLNE